MDLLLLIIASVFIVRKKKLEWVLVIAMALGSSLFQADKFFEGMYVIPNMHDGTFIILLFLYIKLLPLSIHENNQYNNIRKFVFIFCLYIALTIVIDIIANGTSIISVIRTSRHWVCLLLSVLLIPKIPAKTLYRVLDITLLITLIISAIITIEHIAGTSYFTKVEYDRFGEMRGALPSTFALFFAILVLSGYFNISNTKKYIYFTILVASQFVSSTRSIALAVVLALIVYIYYKSKDKGRALFKVVGFCILAYGLSFTTPTLNKRLNEAIAEVVAMDKGSKDVEGNMTFRLYILEERYEYIKKNPIHYIFGIGNVVENDFKDVFNIGLYNKDGDIIQLDTGDIAWPLIILRLGMLGLVLYLILFFRFISIFITHKKDMIALSSGIFLISNVLIISFAGSTCAHGAFWLMPTICLWLVLQRSETQDQLNPIK